MSFLNRISKIVTNWSQIWFRNPPGPQLAFAGIDNLPAIPNQVDNRFDDAILWNTPKRRKSIERRTFSKYGSKEWGNMKFPQKNKKIRVDYKTGEYFELGKLAPKTYEKVMEETKEIQQKMKNMFQNNFQPQDKELAVLYENEEKTDEHEGKRIIEMEKPRPAFFSPNLMQRAKTSSDSASNTTVRPTGLG